MVGWHDHLNGHEFEQTLGDGEGQGSLVCYSPWGFKELDTTEAQGPYFPAEHRLCSAAVILDSSLIVCVYSVAHSCPMDCSLPVESVGFSRKEYWRGLPGAPPGDLPHPEIEHTSPASPALQRDSLPTEPPGKPSSLRVTCKSQRALPFLNLRKQVLKPADRMG